MGGGPIPGSLLGARRRALRRGERFRAASSAGGALPFTPRTSWKVAGYTAGHSGSRAPSGEDWQTPAGPVQPVSFRGWGGGSAARGLAASVDVAALRAGGGGGGGGAAAPAGELPPARRPSWDAAVRGVHTDLDTLLGRFSAELSGWQADFRELQRWAVQRGMAGGYGGASRGGAAPPSSVAEIIRSVDAALERQRRGRTDAENKALHFLEEKESLLGELAAARRGAVPGEPESSAGARARLHPAGGGSEVASLQMEASRRADEISSLGAELKAAQARAREAEAALSAATERVRGEGDTEKRELRRRVAALTAQLEKARVREGDEQARLAGQMDEYREEVERERQKYVRQCEALEAQVKDVTSELAERNRSAEALRATVRESQKDMQDLTRDVEARGEKEAGRLRGEIEALEAQLQQARAQSHELRREVQSKGAALGQGQILLKRLEEEIKGLEATTRGQRDELKELRVNLESQLEDKDRQIEDFRVGQETQQAAFVDDQLKLATEMTEELAKAQVELHQARNDCAAQSQHCKDLRRGLSESEHKVSELTAQAATLREELTRACAGLTEAESAAESALVQSLREELRQKEAAFQSLRCARDENVSELKETLQKREASQVQSQLERIGDVPHDTIMALKDLAENLVAGFEAQGDRCDDEILRLQTELSLTSPRGDSRPEETLNFTDEQRGYIDFLHAFLSSELKGKSELPALAAKDSVTFLAQLVEGVHLSAFLQFYDSKFVAEAPVAVRRQCGLPIHMVCSWIAMTTRISHLNISVENQKVIPTTVPDAVNSVLTTTLEVLVHTILHHTVEIGGSLFGEKSEGESVQACILSWLNFLLSESGGVDNLQGLGRDMSSCHAFVALLQQLFGDITGDQWAQGVLALEDPADRAAAVLKMVASLAKSYCVCNPSSYIQPHHLSEGSAVHNIALVWAIFRILMNHNMEHTEMDGGSPPAALALGPDGEAVDLSAIEFTPKKSVAKCLDFMATPAQLMAAATVSGTHVPGVQEVLEEARRVRESYGQNPEVGAVLATLKPVGDISTGVWHLAGRQVKLSMQGGLVVRAGGGFEAFEAFFERVFPNHARLHFL